MNIHSRQWRVLKRTILIRDHYLCQLQMEGCMGRADTVDHIIPREREGTSEADNLQASCTPCNLHKGATDPRFFSHRGRSLTPVAGIPPLYGDFSPE